MSDEIAEKVPPTVAKSVLSSIASSFNSIFNYWGVSINNNTHIINNLYFTRESINVNTNDSSRVYQKIVDQTTIYLEVIPNDQKIMELIWSYLTIDDKFNCTLVCKRFNNIVSEMECFRLIVNLPSMVRVIPRLSRSYKTVIFQRYQCTELKPLMRQMLEHLSHSVIDVRFYGCKFNLMTLCEFLRELPLLESLRFTPVPLKNVELRWNNIDCDSTFSEGSEYKMDMIIQIIAEEEQKLAKKWMNVPQIKE
ncbi:unnamed protein product [Diamesa tonsa]